MILIHIFPCYAFFLSQNEIEMSSLQIAGIRLTKGLSVCVRTVRAYVRPPNSRWMVTLTKSQ